MFDDSIKQVECKDDTKESKNIETESRKTSINSNDDEFFSPDEGDCGWFAFRPKFLQRFNKPGGYLFVFGCLLIIQGMIINGMYNVFISNLERRFQLTSSQTGLIAASYDVAYLLLCLFVSFHGNRGHRPMMLSIGSVVLGLGCFLFSLPHFTTGLYKYTTKTSDLCEPNKPNECEIDYVDEENLNAYFYLFIAAMFICGMGCVPLFTVGYSIIEDSLPKDKAAFYLGLSGAATIVGPVIGYILGAYLLTVYVDFDKVSRPELQPDDPRWVGAWWMGFLVSAALCWVIVTVPMGGFTKNIPGTKKNIAERESESHTNSGAEKLNDKEFGKSFRDLPYALKTMLKNPTFMFTTLGTTSESLLISGYTVFLPKIIQNQFHQTAGSAAFYAGVIAIPGGVFGMLTSGYLMKRFNMSAPTSLKLCMCSCLTVFVLNTVILFYCEETQISGVNFAYNDSELLNNNLTSPCNSDCDCQEEFYSPVCGSDGAVYFTACHAGCQGSGEDIYTNCSCVAEPDKSAADGLCSEDCYVLTPFIAIFFFVVLLNFMTTTPALAITMRCVPETQRTFAMGVQWLIARGLGSIPGPIIFGMIIDTTCILWQSFDCEDGQGSCWLYDSGSMSIHLLITGYACKGLSTAFFSLALYFYKPMKSSDEKEPQEFENIGFEDSEQVGNGFALHKLPCAKETDSVTNYQDLTTAL